MSESRLKENATAVKKLFGTTAKLAQKQAALATLNNVTLPKIYYSIGKRLAGLAQLPPELLSLREKIRSLEAQIAAAPAKDLGEAATGFAAKAKQLAQQAAKATSDAAATAQIHAAYVSLGKAAVEKYGDKSVPKELLPDLQQANQSIDALKEEIAKLGASSGNGALTPARLLLAGGLGTAVLVGFFVLRLFSRDDTPVERSGAAAVAETNRESAESQTKTNPALEELRAGTQRKLAAIKKGGEIDRFRSQMQRKLSEWQTAAEQLKGSLLREPSLQSASDGVSSAAWSELAQRNSQSLEKAYSQMWQRLRAAVDKQSADDNAMASASADDLATSVAAFAAACDEEKASLAKAREQAIAEIVAFRESLKAAKETALGELTKELQEQNNRWEKTAAPLRGQITADAAVTSLEKATDTDGLARLASQSQAELDAFAKQQHEKVREELKRISADSTQRLREVRNQGEAQAIVQTAKQRSEKAVSDSLERLVARREQGIKVLKDFVGMEQHAKSEKARQKQLTGREFSGPAGLRDDELRDVLANAPNVTDLFLGKSAGLTDKCLPEIAKLRDLRRLELPSECAITVEGLGALRDKKVSFLELPKSVFESKAGFELFVSMLGDASLSSPHDSLHRASGFGDTWDLYSIPIGDDSVRALRGVRKIKTLGTPKDATDAGLAAVSAIPDLEVLYITLSPKITDKGIASISQCRNLKQLVLIDDREAKAYNNAHRENRSGSPAGANGLRALKNLEWIDLPEHMRVEECFAPFLNALKEPSKDNRFKAKEGESLESIALGDPNNARGLTRWPCTKTAVKAMAGKKGIRKLRIEACDCDDDMLLGLGDIPDLEELVLWELPRLNGTGLRGLGRAKLLRTVTIHECNDFNDEGLRCLAECESLRTLHLSQLPKTTDAGLLSLGACKQLNTLHIKKTGGTSVAEVKLENAIPDLDVYFEE